LPPRMQCAYPIVASNWRRRSFLLVLSVSANWKSDAFELGSWCPPLHSVVISDAEYFEGACVYVGLCLDGGRCTCGSMQATASRANGTIRLQRSPSARYRSMGILCARNELDLQDIGDRSTAGDVDLVEAGESAIIKKTFSSHVVLEGASVGEERSLLCDRKTSAKNTGYSKSLE
jgi:hypothetical protein